MIIAIELCLDNDSFRNDDETDTVNAAAVGDALHAIATETQKSVDFWNSAAVAPGVVLSGDGWRFFVHDINGNRCGVVRCSGVQCG